MQEHTEELMQKYREEMLRLYRQRQPEPPPEPEILPEEPPRNEPPEYEPPETPPQEPAEEEFPEPDADEDYGTEELPRYIRPVPELPEEWTAQTEYEKRNTAQGYLRVITAAADSAYPVPDAKVTVFTRIGRRLHLSYLMVTDENGESPTVMLPAPPAGLSQEPENERPYASCEIRIKAEGFFPAQANDVHIFAGVTTRQSFQLVPMPLYPQPQDEEIEPNKRRHEEQ